MQVVGLKLWIEISYRVRGAYVLSMKLLLELLFFPFFEQIFLFFPIFFFTKKFLFSSFFEQPCRLTPW